MRIILPVLLTAMIQAQTAPAPPAAPDPIKTMVERLDLEKYKATIKGLTQFGDRLQGTDRNKAAIDWIEAQLTRYDCTPQRLPYNYVPAVPAQPAPPLPRQIASGEVRNGVGGSRLRGTTSPTFGVGPGSADLNAQPDAALRVLNAQPAPPPGPREEVYCTKIGTTHPDEMYIVGAHMDGQGWGEAANDDGSGTALVMELARIMSSPDVQTERSIRFALWNNEETGTNGARAYIAQRQPL